METQTGDLIWKFPVTIIDYEKTEAMVYSSPAYILANLHNDQLSTNQPTNYLKIVVCNTSGSVYVLKWTIGKREVEKVAAFQLPKAVFSSPVWIDGNKFIVGCRDNYLYCLNLHHET
jgi:outer membrane protein assembly factor BamB